MSSTKHNNIILTIQTMEGATATSTTKTLKRPRNSSSTSKESSGSKRSRHGATDGNTAVSDKNGEKVLLAKLAEMQNMFNSQLLLLRQEVSRKLDLLQEKVDQLVEQRAEGDNDVAIEVALAGHATTANPRTTTAPQVTPEALTAAITNNVTTDAYTTADATIPASVPPEAAEPQEVDDTRKASLMERPKDLYALWKEYEVGSENRKPAKLFSSLERGKVKYAYSRRKVFWDTVSVMVQQQGYSTESAIEVIYRDYGGGHDCSVTKILQRMLRKRTEARNQLLRKGTPKERVNTAVIAAALPVSAAGRTRAPLPPSRDTRPATLSKRPKDLFLLWEEYDKGLNGAKPAKLFTPVERGGKTKYVYFRRKVFWNAVSTMMRENGCSSKLAIESIYNQYGGRHLPVTKIIQAIMQKRSESHGTQD